MTSTHGVLSPIPLDHDQRIVPFLNMYIKQVLRGEVLPTVETAVRMVAAVM